MGKSFKIIDETGIDEIGIKDLPTGGGGGGGGMQFLWRHVCFHAH